MFLIYVHKSGINFENLNRYEFLFTDDLENVKGEGWNRHPSNGSPQPPLKHVNNYAVWQTDINLDLVQNSRSFNMYDSVGGIIPLAWEADIKGKIENDAFGRLYFKYGEPMQEIVDKLYNRDIELKIKSYGQNKETH